MKINRCLYISELKSKVGDAGIILIGAGRVAQSIVDSLELNFRFAVDNSLSKQGTELKGKCITVPVYDWQYLREHCNNDDVLLITPVFADDLLKQIGADDTLCDKEVYLYSYIWSIQWDIDRIKASQVPFEITKGSMPIIPKTIHYFWFSGDPYPDKVKRCIDSWHKYCPDFEFRKWDLDSYQTDNQFCNEALSKGIWAFASDYGRCDVLYKYGGIYLDTDVEVVKSLDDLLYDGGFFCFESARGVDPGSGMGAVRGHSVFEEIRKKYESIHFINEDGSENRVNILDQYTSVLIGHGLVTNGEYQIIGDIAVYPPLVFSPYSYRTGIDSRYEKTYAVHHWVSAWRSVSQKREIEEKKEFISSKIKTFENVL